MKVIKLLSFYTTILIGLFLITNAIVEIHRYNVNFDIILEENKQLNSLQEKECIKYYGTEYCDSLKSNWKCREIKSLAMILAEKDKYDPRDRFSYINNHNMLIDKYNNECLIDE